MRRSANREGTRKPDVVFDRWLGVFVPDVELTVRRPCQLCGAAGCWLLAPIVGYQSPTASCAAKTDRTTSHQPLYNRAFCAKENRLIGARKWRLFKLVVAFQIVPTITIRCRSPYTIFLPLPTIKKLQLSILPVTGGFSRGGHTIHDDDNRTRTARDFTEIRSMPNDAKTVLPPPGPPVGRGCVCLVAPSWRRSPADRAPPYK